MPRDARVARAELGHWRTTIGEEVDFVIEAGGKLLPIDVKASASPRLADCAHLRSCSTPSAASNGSHPMCWRLRGGA